MVNKLDLQNNISELEYHWVPNPVLCHNLAQLSE